MMGNSLSSACRVVVVAAFCRARSYYPCTAVQTLAIVNLRKLSLGDARWPVAERGRLMGNTVLNLTSRFVGASL